ncbi:glycosyltransferase [Microbulbifer mangrovi]|uniref:glycosyltransferase n=1 Tax=Microbulbifer mangrovi TaxID=927787 RepID=UPI00099035C4|nr:glycosyltransferase family 2 protein [Microbulbifer mangrovi]
MTNQSPTNKTMPEATNHPHKIFISIVSHGHTRNLAEELQPHTWGSYRDKIIPVVLTNIQDEKLEKFCNKHELPLLRNTKPLGFGANNNKIYQFAKDSLGLCSEDYFFCINPDVITTTEDIMMIANIMQSKNYSIAAPNLIKPDGTPDDNIRSFPKISDMALRYLLKSQRSNTMKSATQGDRTSDWASGAFLCFKSSLYTNVQGFDERYFMYYEDADICRRAGMAGHPTYYLPGVKAIHIGNRKSRGLPTRMLVHHIASALRFISSTSR